MTAAKFLNITGYADNLDGGGDKPEPIVHLLARNSPRELASITFHPDHAEEIAKAIIEAGKAAKEGRDTRCRITFGK